MQAKTQLDLPIDGVNNQSSFRRPTTYARWGVPVKGEDHNEKDQSEKSFNEKTREEVTSSGGPAKASYCEPVTLTAPKLSQAVLDRIKEVEALLEQAQREATVIAKDFL